MSRTSESPAFVYVGTFTRQPPHGRGQAEGISVLRRDRESGELTVTQTLAGVSNPSFVAVHPSGRSLYAVNADPETDGQPGGGVSAFAIDAATGQLTFLNRQLSHGAGPCHVNVDHTGHWCYVANYGGGSVAMLPIGADGRLGPASDSIQHVGSSIHPERQQGPHAHSFNLDPAQKFALVCDLGLDKVIVYEIDRQHGRLRATGTDGSIRPGGGPRHLDFHPAGRSLYVLSEIGSAVTVMSYEPDSGRLSAVESISTLPAGFSGNNSTADIHVHPNGRFVYASNRGHDSIVIYRVIDEAGRLALVGHQPSGGAIPRNFAIAPGGALMYVANQDGHSIVTFRIDAESGQLTPTGQVLSTPSPVCLKFL